MMAPDRAANDQDETRFLVLARASFVEMSS